MKLALSSLLLATAALADPDPPPMPPSTNYVSWCAYQICFNETSNLINCQTNIQNISTNGYPWGNPLNNFYYFAWNCCTYCPDQHFQFFVWWTWGRQVFSTNYPARTNIVVFKPYYVPGTNEVVHETYYGTPGDTLTFRNTLTGVETLSGSPHYQFIVPPDTGSPGDVRGAVTSGGVIQHYTNVVATNIWKVNGIPYKTNIIGL